METKAKLAAFALYWHLLLTMREGKGMHCEKRVKKRERETEKRKEVETEDDDMSVKHDDDDGCV